MLFCDLIILYIYTLVHALYCIYNNYFQSLDAYTLTIEAQNDELQIIWKNKCFSIKKNRVKKFYFLTIGLILGLHKCIHKECEVSTN